MQGQTAVGAGSADELILRVRSLQPSLNSAEAAAAEAFLRNPEAVVYHSITEFAREAGCSEATVLRFSRRLGFKGYREFKIAVTSRLGAVPVNPVYGDIAPDDPLFVVIRKVFQTSVQALNNTLAVLDEKACQRAVDAIVKARDVVVVGSGDAGVVATSAMLRFLRVGKRCQAYADCDAQAVAASLLGLGDVLLAISHSGRTNTTLHALKVAKAAGATTVTVTNHQDSPLAKLSDIVLTTAAFDTTANGEVIARRLAELCIIEALHIGVMMRTYRRSTSRLRQTSRALQFNKS